MSWAKKQSVRWHDEVPGARWFRADLHVHTLDDHPGGGVRYPGAGGDPTHSDVQRHYARTLLKTAIARRVEVIGLTPHAVRAGSTDETSAVWTVVDVWNDEDDEDGVPFRDKIYAVFPGFEPSLSDGARGVHLLFLFDPAIGRDAYQRAFQAVMGGALPWVEGSLRNSMHDASAVFEQLDHLERDSADWSYICLAPHAFDNSKGLFGALKSQILRDFPCEKIAALELGDNSLPEDELDDERRRWLAEGMRKYKHCFFHSSDAYELSTSDDRQLYELGARVTLLKLASPSIEALRQAFLAAPSRLRLAYEKDAEGAIVERTDLPEPLGMTRPWLRRVRVSGGTSFFGGHEGGAERSVEFDLSPDLTCIVGGRMSGKSTFLDGLRVHCDHPLPADDSVRDDVLGRANGRFLAGSPTVELEIRGPVSPTLEHCERWPAQFFTQRELQDAVRDQAGLKRILYHVLPDEGARLNDLDQRLIELDAELVRLVRRVTEGRRELADRGQAYETAKRAKDALDRLAKADAARLTSAQGDESKVRLTGKDAVAILELATRASDAAADLVLPEVLDGELRVMVTEPGGAVDGPLSELRLTLEASAEAAKRFVSAVEDVVKAASDHVTTARTEVEEALVAGGGNAEDLLRFDELARAAADSEGAEAAYDRQTRSVAELVKRFDDLEATRAEALEEHRTALAAIQTEITARFEGAIHLDVQHDALNEPLDGWLRDLRERGITRWWNETAEGTKKAITPSILIQLADDDRLGNVGMSVDVSRTFKEQLNEERRLALRAIRNDDHYLLQWRVGDGYRNMDKLSGGMQVSLLLMLLLNVGDNAPLVIDQPEDELDNDFLSSTILPSLHALKGRRQIIVATHNANIVVNGDADQVIKLEATHDAGDAPVQGAIEERDVKEAIVRTLDGGWEAFELRSVKYGF